MQETRTVRRAWAASGCEGAWCSATSTRGECILHVAAPRAKRKSKEQELLDRRAQAGLTEDLVGGEALRGVGVAHVADEVLGLFRDLRPRVALKVQLPSQHRLKDPLLRLCTPTTTPPPAPQKHPPTHKLMRTCGKVAQTAAQLHLPLSRGRPTW